MCGHRCTGQTDWLCGLLGKADVHRHNLDFSTGIVQLAALRAHHDGTLLDLAGRVSDGMYILPDNSGLSVLHMNALPGLLKRQLSLP